MKNRNQLPAIFAAAWVAIVAGGVAIERTQADAATSCSFDAEVCAALEDEAQHEQALQAALLNASQWGANDRLVGIGCGPEGFTFTAREEDHFPRCEAIGTPEQLCGFDMGDLPTAAECAAYLDARRAGAGN